MYQTRLENIIGNEKTTTEIKMNLYHGSVDDFKEMNREFVFFSTEKSFAEDYGRVKEFEVVLNRVFDSCEQNHIEQLITHVGALYDAYDDVYFEDWEMYSNHEYFCSDTWEIIEPHLKQIKRMGYDAIIVYEGGIQNFITLNRNFKSVDSNIKLENLV